MKKNGNQTASKSNSCIAGISLDEDLSTSGQGIACLSSALKELIPIPKGSILQVQSVKNVSVPKKNQDDFFVKYDPKTHMLKLVVTDGSTTGVGLLPNSHPDFNDSTMPGSKIRVLEPITFVHGILLFSERNIEFLGGYVEILANQFSIQRSMELSRAWGMEIEKGSSNGEVPPPWRPFGQVVGLNKKELATFKAMDTVRNSQINAHGDEGPTQFETLRQEAIADLVKNTDTRKAFAEGKLLVNKDVLAITSEGFSEEEARITLRRYKNNRSAALKFLMDRRDGVRPERRKLPQKKYGDDDSDPEPDVDPSHQPSKDITLFGFLKPVILKDQQKNESVEKLCNRDFPALSLNSSIVRGQDEGKERDLETRNDKSTRFSDGGNHFNDRARRFRDQPRGLNDRGRRFSDRPRGFSDRPRGFNDQGRVFSDRPRGFSDQGRVFSDRPTGFSDRGREFNDRGKGFDNRGRRGFDRSDAREGGCGRSGGQNYSKQRDTPLIETSAVYEPYRGRVSDFPAMGEDLSESLKNSYSFCSQQLNSVTFVGQSSSSGSQAGSGGSYDADRVDKNSRRNYKSFDQQEKDRENMQHARQVATSDYLGKAAAYSSGFRMTGFGRASGALENSPQYNSAQEHTPDHISINITRQPKNPRSDDQVFSIPPFGEKTRSDQAIWSANRKRGSLGPSSVGIPSSSTTKSTWGNDGNMYSDEGYRIRSDQSKTNFR